MLKLDRKVHLTYLRLKTRNGSKNLKIYWVVLRGVQRKITLQNEIAILDFGLQTAIHTTLLHPSDKSANMYFYYNNSTARID